MSTGGKIDAPKLTDLSLANVFVVGDSIQFPQVSNIDASSFRVSNSGSLILPSVVSYTADNSGLNGGSLFEANGVNSTLSLPHLTKLEGTTGWAKSFAVSATNGGQISFPKLAQIEAGSINFTADGGTAALPSHIALNVLTSFHSTLG